MSSRKVFETRLVYDPRKKAPQVLQPGPVLRAGATTFEIGRTRFGQLLTLEQVADEWKLVQHASSQRDETQWINVTDLIAAAILAAIS